MCGVISAFHCCARVFLRAEIRQRVEDTAKLLRIDHLLDKSVSGLAGGDRQRVALGPRHRAPAAGLSDGRTAWARSTPNFAI